MHWILLPSIEPAALEQPRCHVISRSGHIAVCVGSQAQRVQAMTRGAPLDALVLDLAALARTYRSMLGSQRYTAACWSGSARAGAYTATIAP